MSGRARRDVTSCGVSTCFSYLEGAARGPGNFLSSSRPTSYSVPYIEYASVTSGHGGTYFKLS